VGVKCITLQWPRIRVQGEIDSRRFEIAPIKSWPNGGQSLSRLLDASQPLLFQANLKLIIKMKEE
jgi:hypothetical protein